jgi:hypothetical protein
MREHGTRTEEIKIRFKNCYRNASKKYKNWEAYEYVER